MSPSVRTDRTPDKRRAKPRRTPARRSDEDARREPREFVPQEAAAEPRTPPELLFPADDALGG
jgi:hypothetical protein